MEKLQGFRMLMYSIMQVRSNWAQAPSVALRARQAGLRAKTHGGGSRRQPPRATTLPSVDWMPARKQQRTRDPPYRAAPPRRPRPCHRRRRGALTCRPRPLPRLRSSPACAPRRPVSWSVAEPASLPHPFFQAFRRAPRRRGARSKLSLFLFADVVVLLSVPAVQHG